MSSLSMSSLPIVEFTRFGGPLYDPEAGGGDAPPAGDGGGAPPTDPAPNSPPALGPDQVAIPKSELDQLRRHSEQFRGQSKFVQAAQGLGLRSEDDLAQWAPVFKNVQNPSRFGESFQTEPAKQPEPLTAESIQQILDEHESKKARKNAIAEHISAEQAMYGKASELGKSLAERLFGENPSEHEVKVGEALARQQIDATYYSDDRAYSEGPLAADRLPRPLGEDDLGGLPDSFLKSIGLSEGQRLNRIAAAASRPDAPPASSASGGEQPASSETIPEGASRAEILRQAKANLAARRQAAG